MKFYVQVYSTSELIIKSTLNLYHMGGQNPYFTLHLLHFKITYQANSNSDIKGSVYRTWDITNIFIPLLH